MTETVLDAPWLRTLPAIRSWTPASIDEWFKTYKVPPLTFIYKNWEGKVAERSVYPLGWAYGVTEWHPGEPQIFLQAVDAKNGKVRDFAFKDIQFGGDSAVIGQLAQAQATAAFFASVIKSGEGWTQACQEELDKTMRPPAHHLMLNGRHVDEEPNDGNSD